MKEKVPPEAFANDKTDSPLLGQSVAPFSVVQCTVCTRLNDACFTRFMRELGNLFVPQYTTNIPILNLFPKGGLIVEDYFNENPGRYDKMSGVTELRELTPFQKRRALKMIYDLIHNDPQQLKMKEKKRQEYMNG